MEIPHAATLLHRCGASAPAAAPPAADPDHEWALLLRRYGGRLEAGARRALRLAGARAHREVVEDLVQEICCRLWEKRGASLRRFRGGSDAQASCYLRRLAENTALDVLRAASAQKRAAKEPGAGEEASIAQLEDPGPTPEEWTLGREKRRLVLRRLRSLCAGRNTARNAWILRRALIDGWTAREIGRALGLRSESSVVESLVFRARRQLRAAGIDLRGR